MDLWTANQNELSGERTINKVGGVVGMGQSKSNKCPSLEGQRDPEDKYKYVCPAV